MPTATIGAPAANSQKSDKPAESQDFNSGVGTLALEFVSKKPEIDRFDSRKDRYRAIMVHVIAALYDQSQYSERKSRVADAGARGVEACTDMEKVCADYEAKAMKAAHMLLSDKELASEAMAEYMTQRMSRTDMQELTVEKRKEYREVKEEIRALTDTTAFKFNIPLRQANGKAPTLRVDLRH